MSAYSDHKATERAERLAVIAEQVADGTLTVRQATPEERATWPTPREPLKRRYTAPAPPPPAPPPRPAPPPPRRSRCWRDDEREALHVAAVAVLEQGAPRPLGVVGVIRAVRALPDAPRAAQRSLRTMLASWAADPASPVVATPSGRTFTVRSVREACDA